MSMEQDLMKTAQVMDRLSLVAERKQDSPKDLFNRAVKAIKAVPSKDWRSDIMDTLHGFLQKDAYGNVSEVRDGEIQRDATDEDLCDDLSEVRDMIKLDL